MPSSQLCHRRAASRQKLISRKSSFVRLPELHIDARGVFLNGSREQSAKKRQLHFSSLTEKWMEDAEIKSRRGSQLTAAIVKS